MPSLKQYVRRACRRFGLRIPFALLRKDDRVLRRAEQQLSKHDTVIDLGAHIGDASLEFARYAGEVYAFEPHPLAFRKLVERTDSVSNIHPIEAAASDQDGLAELFFDDDPSKEKVTEGASLRTDKTNVSYANSTTVRTSNLAGFIKGLGGDVGLIKMDVEGHEYRLIDNLIDADLMGKIRRIAVEDHCDRASNLSQERDRTLRRIDAMGLRDRFSIDRP